MKHLYFLIALLFGISLQAQITGYNLNDVVDDFTVTDTNGETHNLYSYTAEGKYVYLDFSYTTCGPCQGLAPKFNQFYDKYGCNSGDVICLGIFGTNNDMNADVESFEETYGGTDYNHAPVSSMEGGANAVDIKFHPSAYPTVCLIAPDNRLINRDIWPINTIADLEATFPEGFDPEVIDCSSIGSFEASYDVSFKVFPNPFNGKEVQIQLVNSSSAQVTIYNLIGEKVYSKVCTHEKERLYTDLVSGTYFISVKSDKKQTTQKLIVK